jgi:hypothetical protein
MMRAITRYSVLPVLWWSLLVHQPFYTLAQVGLPTDPNAGGTPAAIPQPPGVGIRSSSPQQPEPATCPPARLRWKTGRVMPTLLTGDSVLDVRLRRAMQAAATSMLGDQNRACQITYFKHHLLGMRLTSELIGAGVSVMYRRQTLDLCTGRPLSFPQELSPRRKAAFQQEANRRLQQQLEAYIREHHLLHADDIVGLRAQEFVLDPEQLALTKTTVFFPYQVSYSSMSNSHGKDYASREFGPAFTFKELQAYLRPTSPLRRLTLP